MGRETLKNPVHAGSGGRTWAIVAAFVAAVVLQLLVQLHFDARFRRVRIENLIYLPTGARLRAMSLGYQNLVADALWVKAIGYFGGHNLEDKEYPLLFHILNQITNLDPPFRHPYIFGGLVLSEEEGNPEQAIHLLRKGYLQYPGDWRFPFYLGFNYFYHLKDPERAAGYIRLAASIPGRPQYLPRLAASLLTRAGRMAAAIAFLETVAAETREDYVREGLYRKIEELRAGQLPEHLVRYLSDGEGGDD